MRDTPKSRHLKLLKKARKGSTIIFGDRHELFKGKVLDVNRTYGTFDMLFDDGSRDEDISAFTISSWPKVRVINSYYEDLLEGA